MPYVVRKDGPADNPYCVYKESGGETMGCHPSESKAWRQVAAIELSTHHEQKSLVDSPALRLGLQIGRAHV